ncbi:MAG: hypothetical protein ABR886_08005 [Dehalococcoidales bacterium]
MDRQYVKENAKSLERLRKLVNNITDDELKLVIYKEGLTIAALLGHVAFWDERRRFLLRKWKLNGVTPSMIADEDVDILNDALTPFFLAISPRKLAEMAIRNAEALDNELEKISPELIKAIEAIGDRHALNRGIHRNMHLDEIDAFLKAKPKVR